jgi:hypothetical protein
LSFCSKDRRCDPKLELLTADELQAAVETTARWTMVRDELKATLDGVNSAVLTMKHSLGQSILLTYTVSKKLVKVP